MRSHTLNRVRRLLPLLVAAIVWAPASLRSADPTAKPTLVSVTKIWDRAPHCAFTDLLRWKNRWLCTFREAKGHGGDNGVVRVITSADGTAWKSLAVIRQAGIDLRDPKLSVHPDGRQEKIPLPYGLRRCNRDTRRQRRINEATDSGVILVLKTVFVEPRCRWTGTFSTTDPDSAAFK